MTAPTVHADLGAIWLTRDDQQVYLEPHEAEATARAILATLDALLDAV